MKSEDKPLDYFTNPDHNICAGEYDPNTQTLTITFEGKPGKPNKIYTYQNFPEDKWKAFKAAPSKGDYFQSVIITDYKGIKK